MHAARAAKWSSLLAKSESARRGGCMWVGEGEETEERAGFAGVGAQPESSSDNRSPRSQSRRCRRSRHFRDRHHLRNRTG